MTDIIDLTLVVEMVGRSLSYAAICLQIPLVAAQTASVIQVPQIAGAQPSCK